MFQRLRHRITFVLWLTAACSLCVDRNAAGQQVIIHLRNGDRVTGFIVSDTTNRIVLSNQWSASITLPQADIARREPVAAVAAVPTNATPAMPQVTNAPVATKPGLLFSG